MTHYALIGHPLGHSLSPQIHRALLAAAHLEGDYRLLDIAPEDLANRLPELQTLRGFNVTIPHKQAVLSAMAELDEKAALFGAVNTVAVRGGRFYGYNTDCYGFLRSLSAAGIPLAGRVLVLGTGKAMPLNITYAAWSLPFSYLLLHQIPGTKDILCALVVLLGALLAAYEKPQKLEKSNNQ